MKATILVFGAAVLEKEAGESFPQKIVWASENVRHISTLSKVEGDLAAYDSEHTTTEGSVYSKAGGSRPYAPGESFWVELPDGSVIYQ